MFSSTKVDRRELLSLGAGAATGIAFSLRSRGARAASGNQMQQIAIASTSGDDGTTLIELMKSQGFLKKYDLEANFVTVSDGSKILAAVLSGSSDICRASGFDQTLAAINKGAELKVIGGACLLIPQEIYTTRADIKSLKDLEGRVVGAGAPGALLYHMTQALLKKHDVDVSKVRFVNVGSSTDVFRAVVAGTVDAGPCLNNVHDEQKKYGVHSIAEFWKELPEYPYQACYTSVRAIEQKRDLLVRALAVFQELYNFVQSDKGIEAYVEADIKANGEKDPARPRAQARFFNQYKPFQLMIPDASIEYLQKLNIEDGSQKAMMPIDKIVDLSLARDAMKLVG